MDEELRVVIAAEARAIGRSVPAATCSARRRSRYARSWCVSDQGWTLPS
jgi:hypothetical protein